MQSTAPSLRKIAEQSTAVQLAAKALLLGAGLMMLSSCSVDQLDARAASPGSRTVALGTATVALATTAAASDCNGLRPCRLR